MDLEDVICDLLQEYSDQYRAVFLLSFSGRDDREIARALGLDHHQVEHIRDQIREIIQQQISMEDLIRCVDDQTNFYTKGNRNLFQSPVEELAEQRERILEDLIRNFP